MIILIKAAMIVLTIILIQKITILKKEIKKQKSMTVLTEDT